MPHLVVLYTPNLESRSDMTSLCRSLADVMLEQRVEDGRQVFPTGGTRVLAFPAVHFAVADGNDDYGFIYLNLRMGLGRSAAVKKRTGDELLKVVRTNFQPVVEQQLMGCTLQIDESPGQVYDGKFGNLHARFQK